jgi:hemin uptake protein HemP
MVESPYDAARLGEVHAQSRQVPIRNGEIDSQELFQREREVKIRHGDQIYRLRLTGLNKLILTKEVPSR